jgi:CubicO group peptidase (beta-lactamase class C family)
MTVRDLLTHMSGLGFAGGRTLTEMFSDDANVGTALTPGVRSGRAATLETMVDRYAQYPLEFHPGTHWFYSVSTDICGRLVEIMSGQRFDEYLRDTIFTPLGMTDTSFVVPAGQAGRFAACYRRDAAKRLVLVDDPQRSGYLDQPTFFSGGGGLVSTTGDYLRFCQMLSNGGHLDDVRVDRRADNRQPPARRRRVVLVALPGGYGEVGFAGLGFGLTMAIAKSPAQTQVIGSPGEYMWGGAASTIFWVDPPRT